MQYPLSLVSIKYKHFLLFGLGVPILNTLLWFALRLHGQGAEPAREEGGEEEFHECIFMSEKQVDVWVMQVPMLIILVFNTFFLIWIISVSQPSGTLLRSPRRL